MKITAQEEYGLRCMLQLVRSGGDKAPVQVPQIAEAEGLSVAYAEKLLRILSQAGLVESLRGARGGYRLSKPLESLSLGDVLRALGDLPGSGDFCKQFTGGRESCAHEGQCSVRFVWSHVFHYLNQFFDSIPLASLVNQPAKGLENLLPVNPPRAEESEATGVV